AAPDRAVRRSRPSHRTDGSNGRTRSRTGSTARSRSPGAVAAGRREPQARDVVQRHRVLVGAPVPGPLDAPAAVRAAPVYIVVERGAPDEQAVLGDDDRVVQGPDAGGAVAVQLDLRAARGMRRD